MPARYYRLMLERSHLKRRLIMSILRQIEALPGASGSLDLERIQKRS